MPSWQIGISTRPAGATEGAIVGGTVALAAGEVRVDAPVAPAVGEPELHAAARAATSATGARARVLLNMRSSVGSPIVGCGALMHAPVGTLPPDPRPGTPVLSLRTPPHRTVPPDEAGCARTNDDGAVPGAEQGAAPKPMALAARPAPAADLITLSEAARLAGVSRDTVRTWADRGDLPTVGSTASRTRRVRRADLVRLLGQHRGNGSHERRNGE